MVVPFGEWALMMALPDDLSPDRDSERGEPMSIRSRVPPPRSAARFAASLTGAVDESVNPLCSAGSFPADGGFGVEACVEVLLEQGAAFAGEWGAAAGWEERQRFGVGDGVGPAAFVDPMVVKNAEAIEVVFGGRAAVDPMPAMVSVAADRRPVTAGEQASAIA